MGHIASLEELNQMVAKGGARIIGNPLDPTPATKKSKYRNVKVECDGIVFDSKKECARYTELRILERAGEIKDLQRQVKFSLDVNGFHICNYFADFSYLQDGELVIEDCKSPASKTPAYRIKYKLVRALFGIFVLET